MTEEACIPHTFGNRLLWQTTLDGWLRLLKDYEKAEPSDPDLAYWYGERPLTGLLGTAAWLAGGWSLEEFGAERKGKSGRVRQGRGDLRFGTGDAVSTVEAKICWAIDELPQSLKAARKQLRKLVTAGQDGQPVSVCYVVPCYGRRTRRDVGEVALTKLQDRLKKEGMATAKHFATIQGIEEEREGLIYPGVLLVAREEAWPAEQASAGLTAAGVLS